ncbi:hypothetical protein GCM10022406_29530 [Hymenobacter algoricola]|uniref:Uncharacterized protein n=1 Tax=Hymenobacter algoricola TaxID=486267 RepID=A0ABP7NFF4_9BACT
MPPLIWLPRKAPQDPSAGRGVLRGPPGQWQASTDVMVRRAPASVTTHGQGPSLFYHSFDAEAAAGAGRLRRPAATRGQEGMLLAAGRGVFLHLHFPSVC